MVDISAFLLLVAAVLFVGAVYFGWGRGRGRGSDDLRKRVLEIAGSRLDPSVMPRGDAAAQADRVLESLVRHLESEVNNLSESETRYKKRLETLERLSNAGSADAIFQAALDEAMGMTEAAAGYVGVRNPEKQGFEVKMVSGLSRELIGQPLSGLGEQATKEPSVLAEIFGTESAALPWEKEFRALLAASFGDSGATSGVIALYGREELFTKRNLEDVSWVGEALGSSSGPRPVPSQGKAEPLIDEVTKVYNDRFFWNQMEKELDRSRRFSHPISLLLLSVDNFDLYVDAYGQSMADRILKLISDVLRKNLREVDIIARHKGYEFAVILPETDLNGAKVTAEKLRQEMQGTGLVVDQAKKFWLTVSIGAATSPLGESTSRGLFHVADQALNQASQSRNRVVNYVLSLTGRRAEGS